MPSNCLTLKELMRCYLSTNLKVGWASESPNIIHNQNGEHCVYGSFGGYLFFDQWFSGKDRIAGSHYRRGTTTISYSFCDNLLRHQEIWSMSYQGWYTPEAIESAVIPALRYSYKTGLFCGGRGLSTVTVDDNIEYHNIVFPGDFDKADLTDPRKMINFSGIEYVFKRSGKNLGYHQYMGGLLIDPKHFSDFKL